MQAQTGYVLVNIWQAIEGTCGMAWPNRNEHSRGIAACDEKLNNGTFIKTGAKGLGF